MKNKKMNKKLSLAKDTVRELSTADAVRVAGGAINTTQGTQLATCSLRPGCITHFQSCICQ